MDRRPLVDLGAITGNVAALCERVRGSQVMAVVKADGYGHGMIPAARAALAGGATRPRPRDPAPPQARPRPAPRRRPPRRLARRGAGRPGRAGRRAPPGGGPVVP